MKNGADFWDSRFDRPDFIYGTEPNAFLAREAGRLRAGGSVLELGAGEGRNAVWLARQGHEVTVVDYAAAGLRKAEALASEHGVTVEPVQADVLAWQPHRRWDAVVVTFLHLSPADRPALYQRMQDVLEPGGLVIAEWFRPEQIGEQYPSGGPPSAEMMVTADELAAHFVPVGVHLLEAAETVLSEGDFHQGLAAVVRLVWEKPAL